MKKIYKKTLKNYTRLYEYLHEEYKEIIPCKSDICLEYNNKIILHICVEDIEDFDIDCTIFSFIDSNQNYVFNYDESIKKKEGNLLPSLAVILCEEERRDKEYE